MVIYFHMTQFIINNVCPDIIIDISLVFVKKHSNHTMSQSELEGISLAENVACVVEDDSDGPFYIIELAELYTSRPNGLGGAVPGRIHTPLFQERILSQRPWLKGHWADKKLYIACEAAIGKTTARKLHRNSDHDVCDMAETATNLREATELRWRIPS